MPVDDSYDAGACATGDAWDRTIPQSSEPMKPDVAFYYPGQYWIEADWAKNLVLFFDGIGMLIPSYMPDQGRWDDIPIIQSLKEHGLFRILRPELLVGYAETQELATAIQTIIELGGLDSLERRSQEPGFRSEFGSISMSRMGYSGDFEVAEVLHQSLLERGLASRSQDGVSIPMHREVRGLILVLLSQIIKSREDHLGITLSPATDQVRFVKGLNQILVNVSASSPTPADLVSFDTNVVGIDLASVPMEEVLAFRAEHYSQHRDYRLAVRKFARELSEMPAEERPAVMEQREEELKDAASDLSLRYLPSWRQTATFALGLFAAGMSAYAGRSGEIEYLVPATAAVGLSAVLNLFGARDADLGCYSYLFEAKASL